MIDIDNTYIESLTEKTNRASEALNNSQNSNRTLEILREIDPINKQPTRAHELQVEWNETWSYSKQFIANYLQ
jgi:hypothetical protein